MSEGVFAAPLAPPRLDGEGARNRATSLPRTLRGAAAPLIAGATAVVLVVRMAWQAGGYFPYSYVSCAEISFGVLGVLLLIELPRYRLTASAMIGLSSLIGLAAWTGISSGWSVAPDHAVRDMQLTLAYVGLFGLGLVAAGSGRQSRMIVWGVLAAIFAIVGAGLLSRVYPHLINPGPDVGGLSLYRLDYPLSYWNTFGALAAVGSVLALGLAADPRAAIALRASTAGAAVLMFVAMYLSLSRGAWLALGFGLIVLIALGAHRGSLLLTTVIVGCAGTLAVIRLGAYPALVKNPHSGGGAVRAGSAFGPQLLLLVGAAVVAQTVLAASRASPVLMAALRRTFRPVLIAVAIASTLFAVAAYGVRSSSVEGFSAARLHSASHFVRRQWNDFLTPTTFTAGGTARLTTARGTRSDMYRVAFDGFESDPLRGDGAGSFPYRWIDSRRVDEAVRNAHSLEFETLGELGVVGGVLLLAFLGSMVTAAVQVRTRRGSLTSAQSAAVGGACAVWIFHSAVDWDWQMPALTGAVIVLAAALYPHGRRRGLRRPYPSASPFSP